MSGVKIFQASFRYLTDVVKKTIQALDPANLKEIFRILIATREQGRNIIVDGQGRSLQSLLLMEDCLEHNHFPIILPVSNANLRPWQPHDVFIFNSGSGSGSTLAHAQAAKEDGLYVIGMTYNKQLTEEFNHLLVLEPSKRRNPLLAPLGTEFELSSAVIGTCLAYSVSDTPENSLKAFQQSTNKIMSLYEDTYAYLEEELESLMKFISLIEEYLPTSNVHKIYFRGVGRDETVNRVAAIRYGHLHKHETGKNLRVIYEGHWDLRKPGDLAIVTSGSGATSQTLDYAMQAFISGMKVFGITSFKNSDLGKFTARVDGCLVLPGREEAYSMYNLSTDDRQNYLPAFELNYYITLDCLLAQIASNHEISEADMQASHRPKKLE